MQGIADFMGKDHDRLDGLFKEFQSKKVTEPENAQKSFFDFKSGLERHIVWEEEILFPIFEERTGMRGGPTNVMRTEHVQIKELLGGIYDKILKSIFQTETLESQIISVLSSHNVKEENVLYPWIDQTLSLEEIERTLQNIQGMGLKKQEKENPVKLGKIYG
ncbi:MAG: hemerythrin domain-containing protein [Elusimicrobia bacterium]|nr:hemerythrin domain-containing protein [Elusimicrobiota bacterium]